MIRKPPLFDAEKLFGTEKLFCTSTEKTDSDLDEEYLRTIETEYTAFRIHSTEKVSDAAPKKKPKHPPKRLRPIFDYDRSLNHSLYDGRLESVLEARIQNEER